MIGLGGTSTLGIGLIIELRDRFTQNANKISNTMNSLHGNANKAIRNSLNLMTTVGTGMAVVGYGITRGMKASVEESIKFQQVLLNVKALGEMTNGEMTMLGRNAQSLGPRYGRNAIVVAKGMEDLVKAGLKANDIPKVMEAILQTATAAGDALEGEGGVAARMTDIMMAWGMNSNQAARAGDIMAKASIESTVSFGDLAESMKYSQDILKGLHMTFEESIAMMGVLGNAGIKASMSGTALGNAWREIAIALGGGSEKKNKALASLGLSRGDLMDAYGNLKRPLEILDKIKRGVKGMGDVQRQNVLNDLFGVRGKRGINPLLDFLAKGENDKWMGKSFADMIETLTHGSTGANMKIIEEKSKGIAFQSERLSANWNNFKIAVGNALLPLITRILPILNRMLEKLTAFAQTGLGKWLIRGIALFGLILIPMGVMLMTIGLIGRGMMGLTSGLATFRSTGLWVWNTLIARALTYLGIINGIGKGQRINAAGSLINAATGRIITPAYKMAGGAASAAASGSLGILGRITPLLSRFGSALSGILPVLGIIGRFLTPIGLISGFLAISGFSFKQQIGVVIASLKWLVASIGNVIMSIIGWIPGVDRPDSLTFSQRQNRIYEHSYGKNDLRNSLDTPFYPNSANPYKANGSGNFNSLSTPKNTHVHVYIDGQKVLEKKINEGQENELSTQYGLNQ
jgi:TP901 family phage tail tape measure protein